MNAPKIDGAPGLRWRKRSRTYVGLWIARDDIVADGYPTKTQRLWEGVTPTDVEKQYIRSECTRLQDEMLTWSRGLAHDPTAFDGTIAGLIRCYQHDPDSRYQNLRYKSRKNYDKSLSLIERAVGARALHAIKGPDFKRWHEQWIKPLTPDGLRRVDTAHFAMVMVGELLRFGVFKEFGECLRLVTILGTLDFENGRARTEELTREQAVAICAEANRVGRRSIALAQAIQFETGLRQKDVVGEWLPVSEPGMSLVLHRGKKWMYGIDWREITQAGGEMFLKHRLSKSLKGRARVLDVRAGKTMRFHLRYYPMISAELARIPPEARTGPLIKDETHGRPFANECYSWRWREIARAVGVPDEVQNRDSRAGMVTEGIEVSGGDMEAARQSAGHSRTETTQRYNRGAERQIAKIAQLRSKLHKGE